jgi:hypothetical protein
VARLLDSISRLQSTWSFDVEPGSVTRQSLRLGLQIGVRD